MAIINTYSELTSLADNDTLVWWDSTAGAVKKVKWSTLLTAINVAISSSIATVWNDKGTIAFASLPSASAAAVGDMYNVSTSGTTTSDFVEGAGYPVLAGANVRCLNVSGTKKWDALSGYIDTSGFALTSSLPSVMTGATSEANGTSGLVPQPLIADRTKFLKGDGTYAIPAGTSDLPELSSGDAGKILQVNEEEDGYDLIPAPSVYDKVIRTQGEFETLITDNRALTNENIQSSTWLGAKSVALIGEFTLSFTNNCGVKIPQTVKQIHGFNGAKITITNFDESNGKGGLWYNTKPTTNDYNITGVDVDCTGLHVTAAFVNLHNMGIGTGVARSLLEEEFGIAYGFYNCTNIGIGVGVGLGNGDGGFGFYNCTNIGIGVGTGTSINSVGYSFYNCHYCNNCRQGSTPSTTEIWGGSNTKIDYDSCDQNA